MKVLKRVARNASLVVVVIFTIGAYNDWTIIGQGCLSDYQIKHISVDKKNRVHIVWIASNGFEAYRRSPDGGATWDTTQPILDYTTWNLAFASNREDNLYAVTNDSAGIYFYNSNDGGSTWSTVPETIVTFDTPPPGISGNIAAAHDNVYIAWRVTSSSSEQPDSLFMKRSYDAGLNWQQTRLMVTDTVHGAPIPLLAACKNYVYLFYGCSGGTAYFRSSDSGVHWSGPTEINTMLWFRGNADMDSNHVYLSFGPRIYYFNVHSNATHWDTLSLPFQGGLFYDGSIVSANGNQVAAAWEELEPDHDTIQGNDPIHFYITASEDSGRTWVAPALLKILPESTVGTGSDACVRIALDDRGYVHLLTYSETSEIGPGGDLLHGKVKLLNATGMNERDKNRPPDILTITPNPARRNEPVEIRFTASRNAPVSLQIYDLTGRLIRSFQNQPGQTALRKILWDRRDNQKKKVAVGIYLVRLKIDTDTAVRKVILLD